MNKSKIKTPVVIIPSDRTATLGIARSLGRKGIKIYSIDPDPNAFGMVSKFTEPIVMPHGDDSDEAKLEVLTSLGNKLKEKAVLFPVSDVDVIFSSKYREQLSEFFISVMPEHNKILNLVTKDGLQRLAEDFGVPSPKNFQVDIDDNISEIATGLTYPVIIKPIYSASWSNQEIISMLDNHPLSNPPKVALCGDSSELISKYERIAKIDPNIIIQEVIPGEDNRLFYACFYMDRDSNPLAIFVGQKLRILPVGFGSATYVKSIRNSELIDLSKNFLVNAGYKGLGGIEFKKDPRDELFKLIEFNARFGLWDSLSMKCGLDIPFIAYCDALGIPNEPQSEYQENVLWIDFERDIRAFIIYRSHGKIKFLEWIRSYFGKRMWSVFSMDDLLPSLNSIKGLIHRIPALIGRIS